MGVVHSAKFLVLRTHPGHRKKISVINICGIGDFFCRLPRGVGYWIALWRGALA